MLFVKHLYKVLLKKVIVYTTQVTTQSSQSLKAVRVVNDIFGMQLVLLEDITFNYYQPCIVYSYTCTCIPVPMKTSWCFKIHQVVLVKSI